ncbi:MAG: universal stress protein [Dehalococcoidia bacterium]
MARRTIVLPLDGSSMSASVMPYAVGLAKLFGDEIDVLAVAQRTDLEALDGRFTSTETEELHAHVAGIVRELREQGVICHRSIEHGSPAEVILRHAEEPACRAVVMATHGSSDLDRVILGSVADTVRRHASVPVLVLCPDTDTTRKPWHLQRLLVPLDGTLRSQQALVPAAELAQRANAEIVLASVQPWMTVDVARRIIAGTGIESAETDVSRAVSAALHEVARAVAGVRVHTAALRGRAASRLLAFAREERIDLVVMASHGHRGLGRFVHDSVADRLVRGGLPVYLIPARSPTDH